jgi:membrane-bound ClpP family serine protease
LHAHIDGFQASIGKDRGGFFMLLNPAYFYKPTMFMLTIILIILLLGLVLTVIELFFIPGTTIVGVLGVMFTISGIIFSYKFFGTNTAIILLVTTTAVKLGIWYYSFQNKAWSKFSLKSSIQSKVNEGLTRELEVGTRGMTVSTLRPVGKAAFKQHEFEVKTSGGYLEKGVEIKITRINANQITVEPT